MARNRMGGALICSFCNKPESDDRFIVPGPGGICICDRCVDLCESYIKSYRTVRPVTRSGPIPTPQELKDYLDEYVIGQEQAKRVLFPDSFGSFFCEPCSSSVKFLVHLAYTSF